MWTELVILVDCGNRLSLSDTPLRNFENVSNK